MTIFNILAADKSPGLARIRLGAVCIVLLLAACALGEKAHAAVSCGPGAAHPAAAQCRSHPARAGHATQATGAQGLDASGARLTPLASTPGSARAAQALPLAFYAHASAIDLPVARSSGAARVSAAGGALADAVQAAPTTMLWGDLFSPPVAWSILLAGLFGLWAMTCGARVARVQSWSAVVETHAARQSGTAASALDRLDVARYAQSPSHCAPRGGFVRTTSAGRFG